MRPQEALANQVQAFVTQVNGLNRSIAELVFEIDSMQGVIDALLSVCVVAGTLECVAAAAKYAEWGTVG
jgi:hypothetical protein